MFIWVVFCINMIGTIIKRRERHMYVAIWFYIATFVTAAIPEPVHKHSSVLSNAANFFSKTSTVGFPLESQLFFHGKRLGYGLYCFANFNNEQHFYGALICLQIGVLR